MGDLVEFALGLGSRGVVGLLLLPVAEHHRQVTDLLPEFGESAQVGLQVGELAGDALGLLEVVPQVRDSRLPLEPVTCSRIRPGSRTCSTLVSVWFSALISASTSRAATSVKATRHGDDPGALDDHVQYVRPYITSL